MSAVAWVALLFHNRTLVKQQNYPKLLTILMGDKIANPPPRQKTAGKNDGGQEV